MNLSEATSRSLFIAVASIALSGCMVGPNFMRPCPPHVHSYTAHQLPPKTVKTPSLRYAGIAQYYVPNKDIPNEWWKLFHSKEIDQLIRTGLANSPNLAAAKAALRQQKEILNEQIGNLLLPAFDAEVGIDRERFSNLTVGDTSNFNGGSSIFTLYNVNAQVSYNLDFFGSSRRQIEAAMAQVEYQRYQVIAAYLTLTANIVTSAITAASYESQIHATKNLIALQQDQLDIINNQFRLGGASKVNVLTQQTLVEQTKATLPPLEKSLAQTHHALAVLVGKFPNHRIPSINLDKITLPAELPVSLPSNLVKQRPDIQAREALLHAASAQIGVATANLFPQFSITGTNVGWTAGTPGGIFDPANRVWAMIGQITQPILHGGALMAARRASIAAFEQSAQQYRQTLLQAFQNVADSLRAIETDARALRAQKEAEDAAYQNLVLAQDQFRLGGASYLTILNAQQQYQETRISRIQAQATRYTDTAALFQALGGGWWHQCKQCG